MTTKEPVPPTYRPGQVILAPPDFPVRWANPAQARHLWTLDRIHFGDPAPPFVTAIWQDFIAPAFNRVSDSYRLPIRLAFLNLNGYLYSSYQPVGLPPPVLLRGLNALDRIAPKLAATIQSSAVSNTSQRYLQQVEPIIADLDGHWRHNWQPALQQHLSFWEEFNLETATRAARLAHLEESLDHIQQIWEIHFRLFVPAYLALHFFEEFYRQTFHCEDAFAVYGLLRGFDNSFWRAERALWQLSRQVRTMPVVHGVLVEQPAKKIAPALAHSPEGQIFLAEWQAFLDRYGRRGQKTDGLSDISWIEDPSPIFYNLQQLVRQPDRDLEADLQAQIAQREVWTSQTRQRLQSYPQAVRERFETLLRAAQTAVYLHEEHHFLIDQQAMFQLRQVCLAMGRCLAEDGTIEAPADIFTLRPEEVRAVANSPADRRMLAVVKERRAALANARQITPPAALGTMPLMTPATDPLYRAFTKVLGSLGPTAPTVQQAADRLQGQAAAPGVVRGPARVFHHVADVERLQPGDILITEMTLPPWTPLFGVAAGVVTETGGILSHAAIIAREVGIPAVVGLHGATALIRDGQLVEIDGSKGIVRLLA